MAPSVSGSYLFISLVYWFILTGGVAPGESKPKTREKKNGDGERGMGEEACGTGKGE